MIFLPGGNSAGHHHGFDLSDCSSASYDGNWCFSNDKTAQTTGMAMAALSRQSRPGRGIFWEAWLNYWPPVRGKNHNGVYSPADNRHAINPEWWEDLVYGNDRPVSGTTDTVLSLTHLNTYNEPQAGVFSAWLKDRGLLDESNNYAGSIIKFDVAPISGYHGHADCPGHGGENEPLREPAKGFPLLISKRPGAVKSYRLRFSRRIALGSFGHHM